MDGFFYNLDEPVESGLRVNPEELKELATQLEGLSSKLTTLVHRSAPDLVDLGTCLPAATNFASAMSALAGDTGAIMALRAWATELSHLAESHGDAADSYWETEMNNKGQQEALPG